MATSAFKKLLLIKAETEELKKAIEQIPDDIFSAATTEALKKAESTKAHKGHLNAPMAHFADQFLGPDDTYRNMALHALGHHVSAHKAALRGPRSAQNRHLAYQHAQHAMNVLNLLSKMSEEAKREGKPFRLHIPHPGHHEETMRRAKNSTHSPEGMNYGKFTPAQVRDMFGIDATKKDVPPEIIDREYDPSSFSPVDFGHFLDKPAAGTGSLHPENAYRWEDISINGKHIPIDHNKKSSPVFEDHPLNHHPIMAINAMRQKDITPEVIAHYNKKHAEFENSPKMDKFYADLDAHEAKHGEKGPTHQPVYGKPEPYSPEFFGSEEFGAPQEAARQAMTRPASSGTTLFSSPLNYKPRGAKHSQEIKQNVGPGGRFGAAPTIDEYVGPYVQLLGLSKMREMHPQHKDVFDRQIKLAHSHAPHKVHGSQYMNPKIVQQLEKHPDVVKARGIHGPVKIHFPKSAATKKVAAAPAKSKPEAPKAVQAPTKVKV